MTKKEIEKAISAGIETPRSTALARIILHELNDAKWATELMEETFGHPDAEDGVEALKFLLKDLKQEALARKLLKRNTENLYGIDEFTAFADFILKDLKDKDWAIELLEEGIANIKNNNTEEEDICIEFCKAAVYVKHSFKDSKWSSDILNSAIKNTKTNRVAEYMISEYKKEFNPEQLTLLKKIATK